MGYHLLISLICSSASKKEKALFFLNISLASAKIIKILFHNQISLPFDQKLFQKRNEYNIYFSGNFNSFIGSEFHLLILKFMLTVSNNDLVGFFAQHFWE
jgi:hypothetical protein